MSEQKSKNVKGVIVFALCVLIIVVLLILVIYLLNDRQKENEPVKRNVVVNEKNVQEIVEQMTEERTPPGSYEVTMNSTWNFANGDAASENAYVKNAETNTNSVYFDVTRTDTGETIYASPIIPVGSYLDNISLDDSLPAGVYDCLITYHLLDEEDKNISSVKLTLTIVVEQ